MAIRMSSGADLFVVCKQCGAEVSPYITECPYCGNRLRRRAPKLPREGLGTQGRSRVPSSLGRLRPGEIPGIRADSSPYATGAIIAASCVVWVLTQAGFVAFTDLAILGPLHGQWWKLLVSQFQYYNGLYMFVCLVAVAVFGWLLERRHGPLVLVVVFLAAGAAGAGAELLVDATPVLTGANAAALALLAAWVVPDLQAARSHGYYDGDLLAVAVFAVVLLAMPLARGIEVSWIAGPVGALLGLLLGAGVHRVHPR